MNNAAVNMGVHISLRYPVFVSFGCIFIIGIVDHMVDLTLIFWRNFHIFHNGTLSNSFLFNHERYSGYFLLIMFLTTMIASPSRLSLA